MYLSAFNEFCGCEDIMMVCKRTQHTFHSQFQRRFCCTGFCNFSEGRGQESQMSIGGGDQQLQKRAAATRKFSSQRVVGVVKLHGDIIALGCL